MTEEQMKSRSISALALVVFCAPSLGAHFDDSYKAYGGDLNGDGLTDVYVKHEPRMVFIPFDDGLGIPIVLSETKDLVNEVVLRNNGDGSFTQVAASQLSASERSLVSTWRTKVGSLQIGDFNHDGSYDAYLDLPQANFVGQVNDVVLFAPVGAGAPIAQARVDSGFREFFDQIDRWVKNPNYFSDNAPVVVQVVTVTNVMWLPEWCASAAWVAQNGPLENLPPIPTVVGNTLDDIYQFSANLLQSCAATGRDVVHYDYVSVQYQIPVGSKNYSVFNQAALSLSRGALKDAVDAGGIVAGSSNAKIIADVIEGVLRTTVFRGGLRNPSVVSPDEQETADGVDEFRRLRWILEQFELLAYLTAAGSPADEGAGGVPVLLTFDDGPAPTSALAKITAALEAQNIKADFYAKGDEVPPNAAETRALVQLGHKVQNHTWSHPGGEGTIPLTRQTQAQVNEEIGRAQNAITDATDVAPKRFRAPYGIGGVTGKVDPKIQAAATMYGLTVVYWDVDTRDWSKNQGLSPRVIAASVAQAKGRVERANGRPINILMHVQASTAKGLPLFIKALQEAGFSFADPPP
jgi:peptidoglycan/xylan/chitin deacetylase (PgdA/CDA1 family)